MLDAFRRDVARLREVKSRSLPVAFVESLLFDNGFQAVTLHRIASWFKRHRIPVLGALVARTNLFLTGVDIAPSAEIGPGLLIVHGVGIVVGGNAAIGRDAILLHQVTLGAPTKDRRGEMPALGDEVFVGAGATLIGGITVGDGAVIGAKALVTEDVPAGKRVRAVGGIEMV